MSLTIAAQLLALLLSDPTRLHCVESGRGMECGSLLYKEERVVLTHQLCERGPSGTFWCAP